MLVRNSACPPGAASRAGGYKRCWTRSRRAGVTSPPFFHPSWLSGGRRGLPRLCAKPVAVDVRGAGHRSQRRKGYGGETRVLVEVQTRVFPFYLRLSRAFTAGPSSAFAFGEA